MLGPGWAGEPDCGECGRDGDARALGGRAGPGEIVSSEFFPSVQVHVVRGGLDAMGCASANNQGFHYTLGPDSYSARGGSSSRARSWVFVNGDVCGETFNVCSVHRTQQPAAYMGGRRCGPPSSQR